MSASHAWLWFRRFRLFTLSISAVISLAWTVVIVVFLAKNWKGYSSGERGFLGGFAGLDFVSSILLYLMIVVKFDYWWDAARAVMLVGLHTAASVVFTKYGLHWACDGFGSSAYCHRMSMAVLLGSWILAALMIFYGLSLPVMGCVPKPDEPINAPEEYGNINQEEKRTHAPSASRDSLLPPELPSQFHAPSFEDKRASSVSTSMAYQAGDSRLVGSPTASESLYSTTSDREDVVANLNPLAKRYTLLNTAAAQYPPPPFLRPRGNPVQEERPLSLTSGAADGPSATASHEFSIYPGSRQTSVARPSVPSRTHSLSGARAYSSPLTTGTPEDPEAYFDEIMLSDDLQDNHAGFGSESMAKGQALPRPPPTALSHSRSDSSGSNVDINQWRKLVTDAANGTR